MSQCHTGYYYKDIRFRSRNLDLDFSIQLAMAKQSLPLKIIGKVN